MHPGITIAPLIGLAIGAIVGSIITVLIKNLTASSNLKKTVIILTIVSWLAYIGGILYWRLSVEPSLDGTEGAGVGFGAIFIYLGVLVFTLFFTGLAISTIWIQKIRSSMKPIKMPNKAE